MRLTVATLLCALACCTPADAVFHGTVEPADQTPWLVSLTSRTPFCGGALIAPDRVLTAAHCVEGADPAKVTLRIGGGNVHNGRRARMKGAFFPTNYKELPAPINPADESASGTLNDVAVLVLTAPITDVTPLPLAPDAPADGETMLTVGRGDTGSDAIDPNVAYAATQQVVSASDCNAIYGPKLLHPAQHLCTRENDANDAQSCAGDSGSPVMTERNGVLAVAGVVTWGGETLGKGCGTSPADVAERVLPHLPLITGGMPTFAPYPHARVRVRRTGSVRRCVIGAWSPSSATFKVRWYRLGGPVTTKDPDTGAIIYGARKKTFLPGAGKTKTVASGQIGCEVTARTAGGYDVEDSYNTL